MLPLINKIIVEKSRQIEKDNSEFLPRKPSREAPKRKLIENSENCEGQGVKMMHHIFDMDSSYNKANSSSQQRKNRMKRMEELSHSLDDGLNEIPDDEYNRQGGSRGRQMDPRYDDFEDNADFFEDDYNDDYNYYNNTKSFDGRPKSYNDKYSNYMPNYDNYETGSGGNFHRNRYSLNESSTAKNRYQESPVAQPRNSAHSTLRRPVQGSNGNGNGHHGSNKHILFNDEDDVHYMSAERRQSKSAPSSTKSKSGKKETKKEPDAKKESSSLFSSKKKPSKEDLAKPEKSAQQVMKAKLKIQNVSSDDSVLHMRSNSKQNTLHRYHSVDSKLPSHGPDRSNMSPTIMEEIEFEMQDVETETDREVEKDCESEKEVVGKVKEKPSKEKASKEKKGDSAPSTPTTKKSFKAHLTNHKKLFKVPDIDLNNLKFSCFFSSNKNIAALKGKKDEITSKSAEALNQPSPKDSPKSSPTTKTPPASPKKFLKCEPKSDKVERLERVVEKAEEKLEKASNSRSASNKISSSGSTIQSGSDCFKEDSRSGSDTEFEVNLGVLF